MQELYNKLLSDMKKVGVPINFDLELRPYSKTYYGRYNPNNNKVTLYVYSDKDCSKMEDYKGLLLTSIHEAIHSMQWQDSTFVRRKGVMHDAEFYRLLNKYSDRAKTLLLFREVRNAELYS